MRDNISPEEKLLRLIRGEKKDKFKQLVPASAEVSNLSAANPQPAFGKNLLKLISPQLAIRLLLALACIFLLFSIIQPFFMKKPLPAAAQERGGLPQSQQPKIEESKPLASYQQEISGKELFGSGHTENAPAAAIDTNLMENLALVGIISGDNPQAIIEDIKSKKTYYLTKGQYIGAFLIVDIQEGKIIINHSGKRYEMAL